MRVVLVQEDAEQAALITGPLRAAGHTCTLFATVAEFLQALTPDKHDVVLLDWCSSNLAGPDMLRAIREQHNWLPIMAMGGEDGVTQVVHSLEHGADDFLVWPAPPGELLARLAALQFRSLQNTSAETISTTPYVFDLANSQARVNDRVIALNSAQFRLATVFFAKPGVPLSRAYLLEAVWGQNTPVTGRTLSAYVSRVRSTLQVTRNGWRINCIYGLGFRLERVQSRHAGGAAPRHVKAMSLAPSSASDALG